MLHEDYTSYNSKLTNGKWQDFTTGTTANMEIYIIIIIIINILQELIRR